MDEDKRAGVPFPPTPDPRTTHRGDRVTQLKQQLAVGEYRVDSDAVAREMLRKLQLASLSHRALVSYSAGPGARGPVARHST